MFPEKAVIGGALSDKPIFNPNARTLFSMKQMVSHLTLRAPWVAPVQAACATWSRGSVLADLDIPLLGSSKSGFQFPPWDLVSTFPLGNERLDVTNDINCCLRDSQTVRWKQKNTRFVTRKSCRSRRFVHCHLVSSAGASHHAANAAAASNGGAGSKKHQLQLLVCR